jgi:hypothetical protein
VADSFKPNIASLRQIRRLAVVEETCKAVAEAGAEYARSIAPVGDPTTDPTSGDYKKNIEARRVERDGYFIWQIVAADFKSTWIEYGSVHNEKYRVLGKTAEHLGGLAEGK